MKSTMSFQFGDLLVPFLAFSVVPTTFLDVNK